MKSDRPLTMKSEAPSSCSVQHRSDILMEEQVALVKKSQEDLKQVLETLEGAKVEEELAQCRTAVQEAREKSEKSIMVLQVLTKVNTELSFARAELEEALEKQQGDINEARKRVMWLEDRMGVLCGKARLRGQAQKPKKSHRSPETSLFRSRLSSTSEKSSEDDYPANRMGRNGSIGYKSDLTRRGRDYSPSESGSDYPPYPTQSHPGMTDTPSSGADYYMMSQQQAGRMRGGLEDSDSDSEDEDGLPPPLNVPPGVQGMSPSMGAPGMEPAGPASESEDESQQGYEQTATEYTESQSAYTGRYEEESEAKPSQIMTGDQAPTEGREPDSDEEEEPDQQEEDEEEGKQDPQPIQIVQMGVEEEEEEEEVAEGEEREVSDVSERTESIHSSVSGSGAPLQPHKDKEPVFLTEGPRQRSVTILAPKQDRRRVTFRDATHQRDGDMGSIEPSQDDEESEDFARAYWQSEHHRFEYSQYSEMLCDLDPLSYHSVGLAVPGSFIERPERTFTDLPWRQRRKGSDINDIHRIALDKLAGRVHTMYDKLYNAAQLSVKPTHGMEGRRETTMFSSFDGARDGARSGTPTDSRPGMFTAPPTTADGLSRPQTVSSVIVPLKVGLNVYHPKPIPPPEMLPLTRTSHDKVYPRLANQFMEEDDVLSHKPAIRIVDQRNLYSETKLKLYRERPKHTEKDTSSMEKKFRMMLEQEKSMGSRSERSSRQTTPSSTRSSSAKNTTTIREGSASSSISKSLSLVAKAGGTRQSMSRTLTKAERTESETGASTWSRLKPSSRGKEYGGLKWERVKTMVHTSLVSRQIDDRRDAAKHLGLLRCGDAMVFYALKERIRVDEDARVRYEAAKSLILLGCWDEDVLQVLLKYLVLGNTEIRQDIIRTMIDGKNVQYVNKKIPTFPELVKVLSHFCCNPDPEDINAFDAAVLLGRLCVLDENARFKLLRSLNHTTDTHLKAKALETLVKQLSCTSWDVVEHLLDLFRESPVWRYRALAADLLIVLGKEHVCKKGEEEKIYHILERKLWDDPTREVRVSAAKALAALGMFAKACDRIEKRLEDTDEDIRAQAVISVGTLEMKNEKIIRLLLEMLELDSSEYVRLMIARTFTQLRMTDKRVLRALRERDKVDGALARESRKALKVLESLATQHQLTSPTVQKSMGSRGTPRGLTPYTPAVTA